MIDNMFLWALNISKNIEETKRLRVRLLGRFYFYSITSALFIFLTLMYYENMRYGMKKGWFSLKDKNFLS